VAGVGGVAVWEFKIAGWRFLNILCSEHNSKIEIFKNNFYVLLSLQIRTNYEGTIFESLLAA
jgi:hypothetical protein